MTVVSAHTHEDFSRRPEVVASSNRAVGLVIGAALMVLALKPLLRGLPPRTWAIALSLTIAVLALALPKVLTPLNKAWTMLAVVLHRIMSPLVSGLIFFVVITPVGAMRRWFGGNALRIRKQAEMSSYWVVRTAVPARESMEQQF